MNEQLIRDIVDVSANKQVKSLETDLESLNKKLQDVIVSKKILNDTLSQSKGLSDFNKNTEAVNKSNENGLKLVAQRQLAEEKLSAFKANEQSKADARAAKELANEQKLTAAANARTAALEKRAKIISASTQQDLINSSPNGVIATTGPTVSPQNIAKANTINAITAETGAVKQNTKANNDNTLSRKQLALMAAQEKLNLQANALALKNQAKELNAAKGSLDQRRAALIRLKSVFDGLNVSERESRFGQRLSKLIPSLNEQVLTLEKSTGRAQRNVGNYGSAFDKVTAGAGKAFSALRFVANILPGVGLAGLLGFAVEPIINYVAQLEIFKTKISQLKENLRAYNEVNAATSQNYAKDVTSLKILYAAATDVTLSMRERVKAAQELKREYPDSFKNSTTQSILNGNEAETYKNLTKEILLNARARAVRDKLAEIESKRSDIAFQKEKINNAKQNEIAAQTSDQLNRQAQVQAGRTDAQRKAFGNSAATTNKLINDNIIKPAQQRAGAAIKIQDEQDKILEGQANFLIKYAGQSNLIDSITNDFKEPKYKKVKIDTSYIDTLRAEIEAERNAQDAIAKDEQKSLDTRLAALNNFVNLSERLNELDAAKKIKQGKNVGQARAEQNTEDEKVESDAAERKYKINERAGKDLLDLIKSYSQRELDLENNKNAKILESTNEVLENIENRRSEAQQKLTESYANRLINQKQFEAESLRISNDAAKESLETQIDALQQVIDNEKEFAKFDSSNDKKLAKDQRDLTALKIRLSKLGTDARISDLDRELEKQKQVRDSIVDFSKEAFDFLKGLSSSTFESRLQDLDSESKALDKNTKRQIENVNESVASEEDKANQINLINARQEAKQAEIDERVRQTKIRQAKADKAAAIASIIINYAVGYSKNISVLGFLGLPLNAILAATAALQIATVLAQPIPAYKGGKSKGDNYSGSAWVGDGGMSELVIEPNGSMWVTPSTPTLTNVSAGTEIISGPDFKRMLAKPNLNTASGGSSIDLSLLVAEQRKSTDAMVKAFKSQSINSTILTEKGLIRNRSTVGKISEHIGKQFGRRF